MTVIGTNIAAIRAQNASARAERGKQTAMEQLSTGKRINSAKDDAAGLAISMKMTTQIRGLSVAQRNIEDGMSLAQTAEGSLGEVTAILQRMRELAMQAASGTMSVSDRDALQKELEESVAQVDHILRTTQFNGVVLFADTSAGLTAQDHNNDGDFLDPWHVNGNAMDDRYFAGQAAIKVQAGSDAADAIDIVIPTLFSGPDNFTLLGGEVTVETGNRRFAGISNIDLRYTMSRDTLAVYPANPDPAGFVQYTSSPYKSYADVKISAEDALGVIEGALTKVSDMRATLGAMQNRLVSALSMAQTSETNLSDARSRIEDADFAASSVALAREQILSQAATGMLAQANLSQQDVLKLIS